MSIINQMLRDLDARHASANERSGLPSQLRTLPQERASPSKPWFLLAGGLMAGALFAWFLLDQTPAPVHAPPAPVAQPQPAPPAPATPTETPAAEAQAAPTAAVSQPEPKPAPAPVPVPVAKPSPPPIAAPAKPVAAAQVVPVEKPVRVAAPSPVAVAQTGEAQIDKQPKNAVPRDQAEMEYRRGLQAASIGDNAMAIPALRRVLEIDPKHIKGRQALLSVLANTRQWDEVKLVAQNGLALDPTRSGWASILARLQHEQGDTAGAVETLERYAAHATGDVDYQSLFAFLLQKRQRFAEAAQHYQAALALRPGEGRWWFGLGLALEAAGRAEEAKTAFGKARETGNLPADMLGVVEQKLR